MAGGANCALAEADGGNVAASACGPAGAPERPREARRYNARVRATRGGQVRTAQSGDGPMMPCSQKMPEKSPREGDLPDMKLGKYHPILR